MFYSATNHVWDVGNANNIEPKLWYYLYNNTRFIEYDNQWVYESNNNILMPQIQMNSIDITIARKVHSYYVYFNSHYHENTHICRNPAIYEFNDTFIIEDAYNYTWSFTIDNNDSVELSLCSWMDNDNSTYAYNITTDEWHISYDTSIIMSNQDRNNMKPINTLYYNLGIPNSDITDE
jgi:hypothetical protein